MQATAQVEIVRTPAGAAAMAVVARLREAGFATFWVGGCVRDLLLGRLPKDYDVATAATPKQVTALFSQVAQVGASFGVVRVRQAVAGGTVIDTEVATFRADGTYSDGRRPDSVRFTDAREDVLRRDFTINGLLLDPLAGPTYGQVVDWVGGLADLQAGLLRAIGEPERRFGEDALRLLRAPRFAARFGLRIEAETAASVRQLAPTLCKVSVERIHAELLAMLLAPTAANALAMLAELRLAEAMWPTLCLADPGLERALARTEGLAAAVAGQADGAMPACRQVDVALALATLAGDRWGWPNSAEFGRSFCLSRHDEQALRRTLQLASTCPLQTVISPPLPPAWARWLREPYADHALVLLALLQPAAAWPAWRSVRTTWAVADAFPPLGFDGTDLQAWGYRPGPQFKLALTAAEDVRLAGGDLAAAEQAARAVLGPPPTSP